MLNSNAVVNHSIRLASPEYHSQCTINDALNPSDADISLEELFDSTIKDETQQHTQELLNFIDSEIEKLLLEEPL